MNHFRYLLLLALLGSTPKAAAHTPMDVCGLLQAPQSVKGVLTTLSVVGDIHHGYHATSVACPKKHAKVTFAIGQGTRARAFYRWAFATPLLQSGVREIQATVDYLGTGWWCGECTLTGNLQR